MFPSRALTSTPLSGPTSSELRGGSKDHLSFSWLPSQTRLPLAMASLAAHADCVTLRKTPWFPVTSTIPSGSQKDGVRDTMLMQVLCDVCSLGGTVVITRRGGADSRAVSDHKPQMSPGVAPDLSGDLEETEE